MHTYLIQLSGSMSHRVLHSNRSHDNQPIGGVKASPLFRLVTGSASRRTDTNCSSILQLGISYVICIHLFLSFIGVSRDRVKFQLDVNVTAHSYQLINIRIIKYAIKVEYLLTIKCNVQ